MLVFKVNLTHKLMCVGFNGKCRLSPCENGSGRSVLPFYDFFYLKVHMTVFLGFTVHVPSSYVIPHCYTTNYLLIHDEYWLQCCFTVMCQEKIIFMLSYRFCSLKLQLGHIISFI